MAIAAATATASAFAEALRRAVLGVRWPLAGGAVPSVDVAVVGFPADGPPLAANVLLSRELPDGHAVRFGPAGGGFGAAQGVRFDADVRDADGRSVAWADGADWSRIDFPPLLGGPATDGPRFVAPYPASLVKLMVAVGLAACVDRGRCGWASLQADRRGRVRPLADWADAMLTRSDNDATEACVAALHAAGALDAGDGPDALHGLFAALGLPTLRLRGTTASGGWRNADGAGVGRLQMTAWDTVRLLWWLDPAAPPPPWLGADAPRLEAGSRARLLGWLGDQALHEVLSSTALAGVAGWQAGLPARLPARWLDARTGAVHAGELHFPPDVRAAQAAATLHFAHKTGCTDNYASDAGIVHGIAPARRHYLVAVLSNLGRRHAPHPPCAVPWALPQLGAAIDALMARLLDAPA